MAEQNSPRIFHFRISMNGIESQKNEGLIFSSEEDAWQEASNSTGEIIRAMGGAMRPGLDWRMDVTDAVGTLIFRFSMKAQVFKNEGIDAPR